VHGDDGWEESEEAWELGEEEMIIVGTVQQEDSCSWQDASKSWLEQDEEHEAGTYQGGTCQGAGGVPPETGERAVTHPHPTGERGGTEGAEDSWWAPGPEDLLIEGEEGKYFLELLMREAPPEEPNPASSKINQPAGKEEGSRGKAASTKGKGKKKDKKKALEGVVGQLPGPRRRRPVRRRKRRVWRAIPASR
jgi:hypothetical protein